MLDRFMRQNSGCIAAVCFVIILALMIYKEATRTGARVFWFQ